MIKSTRYEIDLIKKLHNAAMTIQNYWRDYILKRKTPLDTEEKNDVCYYLKKPIVSENIHPNNNRSTSRNTCNVPKLDLANIVTQKDKELSHTKDGKLDIYLTSTLGIFNNEPMLDLSAKRIQNLILANDLSSMIKVREEALNYKIKKEKSHIQKLLSSQKISPRT